jgi:hypothetical protein
MLCSYNNLENISVQKTHKDYVDILKLNEKFGINTNIDVINYIMSENDFPDEILDYYESLIVSDNPQISTLFPNWAKLMKKIKNEKL